MTNEILVNGIKNYQKTDFYKNPIDFWSLKLLGFFKEKYGPEFLNE